MDQCPTSRPSRPCFGATGPSAARPFHPPVATRAGSKVLADAPRAATDAPMVHRIRAACAVIVAKTNIAKFALGTSGANPHYGTPGNPADRSRKPGGSSSGAAVAVAEALPQSVISTPTQGFIVTAAARLSSYGRSDHR
jgi:aspartyl-tRNA(Asn)/glutamyl-tRNA(Gln) amidotransferase subunit A